MMTNIGGPHKLTLGRLVALNGRLAFVSSLGWEGTAFYVVTFTFHDGTVLSRVCVNPSYLLQGVVFIDG